MARSERADEYFNRSSHSGARPIYPRLALLFTAVLALRNSVYAVQISDADFDRDCFVGEADYTIFKACAGGADVPYNPANLPAGCALAADPQGRIAADFDRDCDVDMDDFGVFQRYYGRSLADVAMEERVDYYSRHPVITAIQVSATNPEVAYIGTENQGVYVCSAQFASLDECTHLTTLRGLPSNQVRALAHAPDGTLWVGTTNGLSEYKNTSFTNYGVAEDLPHPQVNVLKDDTGRSGVWIGTQNGVAFMALGVITDLSSQLPESNKMITNIQVGPDENVWLIVDGGDVHQYQEGQPFLTHSLSNISECDTYDLWPAPINILPLANSTLWVGTTTGLFRIDASQIPAAKTALTIPGDPDPGAMDICPLVRILGSNNAGDEIWVSRTAVYGNDAMRFALIDPATPSLRWESDLETLYLDQKSSVIQLDDGSRWLGVDGLYEITSIGNNVSISKHTDFGGATVPHLAKTTNNRFWFNAEYRNPLTFKSVADLYLYDNSTIQPFPISQASGLPSNNINRIMHASDASLWIATDAGVVRYACSGGVCGFSDVALPDGSPAVVMQMVEADGTIWVIEHVYMEPYNLREYTGGAFSAPRLISTSSLDSIVTTPDGALWIRSDGDGLYRFKDGALVNHYIQGGGACDLDSSFVRALAVAQDGSIWVAPRNQGLMRIVVNAAGESTCTKIKANLPNQWVTGITPTSGGKLWIGTLNGLALFTADGSFVQSVNLGDNTAVDRMTSAADGSVWASTVKGIAPTGLAHVSIDEGEAQTQYYSLDASEAGHRIPSDSVGPIIEAGDGRIWVGTHPYNTGDGGIAVLSCGNVITTYTTASGLPSNSVTWITEFQRGHLGSQMWIGTEQGLAIFTLK